MEFNRKGKELTLTADGEPQLEAVRKVLVEKMIKRGVDPKAMDPQKVEQATHKTVRQKVKLKSGIDKDTAKIDPEADQGAEAEGERVDPGRGPARQRERRRTTCRR